MLRVALDHAYRPLSYEMNVHRGESATEFLESIARFVVPIRDRVAGPGAPFGLAPRIGRGLIAELQDPAIREAVAERLRNERLQPYTINAFPLEDFHQPRVKENVYRPSWRSVERATMTCAIADRFADWLGSDTPDGTISTSGGAYRYEPGEQAAHDEMARHYLQVIAHLARIERERGCRLRLTVEPEPDTTFELATDVTTFVTEHLLPQLATELAGPLAIGAAEAECLFYRHFNVNLDVCHQSVLFRDPVAEWQQLEAHGIRVGKLHLTSALVLADPRHAAAVADLEAYDEPRYLHQFAARRRDGSILRGCDLGELSTLDLDSVDEVRCHFHVPLSEPRIGALRTTSNDTARALAYAKAHEDPPHLAIETYTWPLIANGAPAIVDGIVREFDWVRERLSTPN